MMKLNFNMNKPVDETPERANPAKWGPSAFCVITASGIVCFFTFFC